MSSTPHAGHRPVRNARRAARLLAVSSAAVAALALPSAAFAATDPATVDGTVGSELSVTAPNSTLSAFSPSTDGTGSSVVNVSSTASSWTLTLHDAAILTAGKMDKVDCTTRAAATGGLANALAYSASGGSGSLGATPQTLRTGSSVEDVTVSFTQGIGAAEDLLAGDCYQLEATFTAT